jgi:amino acid adenylation domain-containing protein
MGVLLEKPTVAELAAAIAEQQAERAAKAGDLVAGPSAETSESLAPLPVIVSNPSGKYLPFPLTDIQQAYWIGRSGAFELGNVATHGYEELECPGLDLERLNVAWEQLIHRHDMLRAIVLPDGQQRILEQVPPYQIEVLDLSGQSGQALTSQLENVRQHMSHQVLRADRWPLFEIRASRLDDGLVRLHISSDALLVDAWSRSILARELSLLYRAPDTVFAPLQISFRDYVLAAAALRDSELYQRSRDYWWSRLSTLPPAPELPLARDPGSVTRPRFERRSASLEAETWAGLKHRAARAGLTPSGLLLAVFAEVLKMWSKEPRFTINVTLFNRLPLHPQVNDIVGDFTSLTLLAVEHSAEDTFEARARRLQQQLWNDLDNRYVSGVEVMRELARKEGSMRGGVMPIVFTSTLDHDSSDDFLAPLGKAVYTITQTPQVWLDYQAAEKAGTLVFNWDTVAELFPDGLLDDMFDAHCRFLRRLAEVENAWEESGPETSRALLPPRQHELRAAVNSTDAPVSEELLHTLFAARAGERPHQPAVITPGRTLTYEELFRRSNHAGRWLRSHGARPNTLVAVVMEKGWEQVVATVGILSSGAAYLPIDPDLPEERIRYLIEHGQVRHILTQSWHDANLIWPEGVKRLSVDLADPTEESGRALARAQQPEDLAYVIFTSGSTGLPKGVMIDHRGAVNTILDINHRLALGPQDRVLALSSLSFDLSVYDIFGPLAAGATIVIPETRDPAHWAALVSQERITIWNSVPALMELLVEYLEIHPERRPDSLRHVMLSGDWVPVSLPDKIKALKQDIEVTSLGGATEASIWSILYPIEEVDPAWNSIPYGRPMLNQRFYVLNQELEPCPVWVTGQLYIGGIGLAKGYWRDGDKTRARFIYHPRTGERLYATGDLGRHLPSGEIEFLGREDFQVKIRGHRIELGEIEAALGQHPGVKTALVTAAGEPRGNRRLVAYVVSNASTAPTETELQRFLSAKLPDYMMPAAFMLLERLPLTSNGKVDRQALPDPASLRCKPQDRATTMTSDLVMQTTELVANVLNVERVDPETNLLDLGVNSIDVLRLAGRLEQVFGVRPAIRDLFRLTTITAIASYLEQHGVQSSLPTAPTEVRGSERLFPQEFAGAVEREEWEEGQL